MSAGTATITSSGTTETINQSTQKAVIDWGSFNIAPNETTKFNQPNSSSTTLNRVNAGNPSQILGTLDANGNVILINPNGVFFGKGSQVDVNGLVATTANISSQNFMQGNLNFNLPGNPNAQVINQGTITASQAGLIGLVAPDVENSGVLNAKLGRVMLGSGDRFSVDLYGDGLINVGVSGAVKQQVIQNSGAINAVGGTIQLTAAAGRNLVNSLISVPGKLNAPAAGMQDGEIIISAAGSNGTSKTGSSTVNVSGTLNASGYGAGQTGGTVNVTGDNVTLASGAVVDASGAAGGGRVNIGGELHGRGPLQNAVTTNIAGGASVKADAVTSGNGGQVTVWSDGQTAFNGNIQATGGSAGGNGGLVETSSHGVLSVGGMADTSSPHGTGGEWLLDPASLTISNGADTNVIGCPNCTPDGTVATSNLTPATIDAALNLGTNVTVTTGGDAFANVGDITVNNAIVATGAGALTLSSYRNIILNAGITLAGGALVLRADNQGNASGYIDIEAAVSTGGGNITMGGGSGVITQGSGYAVGNASGQVIGVLVNGVAVNAGGGNIVINGQGFGPAISNNNYGVEVNGGSISTAAVGTISIDGIGGGTGGTRNTGFDYGVYVDNAAVVSSVNGAISVIGTGGGSGTDTDNYGFYVTGPGSTVETTGSGNVSIAGTGGGATGANNYGIYINDANGVQATVSGGLSLTGTGGLGTGVTNTGVQMDGGSITGAGGAITVNATGGAEGDGVAMLNGSAITNAGGNVTVNGTGGTGNNDPGVFVSSGGTGGSIGVTGTGNVTIIGQGGAGGASYGVELGAAGTVSATNGAINVTGNGSSGGGDANNGIFVNGGSIIASGTSTITLSGTGGGTINSGNDNGISVAARGIVSAVNGDLIVQNTTGGGTGTGVDNNGLAVTGGGSMLETTGTGNISVTAAGGGGTGTGVGNDGVFITSVGGIQTTGSGSVTINGTGGGTASTSDSNGVHVVAGSIVANGGALSITGTGAVNGNGVVLATNGAITDAGGNVIVSGTGGAGVNDTGVQVAAGGAGGLISTTGAGTVTVTGQGGSGGSAGVELDAGGVITAANGVVIVTGTSTDGLNANPGVYINGAGATISATGTGAVNVSGSLLGIGTAPADYGIEIAAANGVQTNGGNISLTGQGGASTGNSNIGIYLNGGTVTAAGAGTITVNGTGGGTGNSSFNQGLELNNGGALTAVNGNIAITAQGGGAGSGANNYGLYVTGAGSTVQTTGSGNVSIAGTGGGAGGSGAGNNGVYINAADGVQTTGTGGIIIAGMGGSSSGGNNDGVSLVSGSITGAGGQNILITGISGSGAGTYGFSADAASSVNATGAGNITIATDTDNFGAASTLTTGTGRWLVYSANPANNNDTALSNNFVRYSCTFGGACPAIPGAGNGLLYSFTPLLTVTPDGIASITYGSAVPNLTGYAYTLAGYRGSDGASDVVSGSVNGSTAYTPTSNVGAYDISYAGGALSSALGYGFSYFNNPAAFTVTPAALTVTANSFGKTYGTAYSFLGSEFTTAGLINSDTVTSVTLASPGAAAAAGVAGSPYAITASAAVGTGLSNYSISYVNGNMTVTPYLLTVTANAQSKVYGAADPALTYTNGGLQAGDTNAVFTGGLVRVAGQNVGSYAINQGTLSAGANYTISYTGNNLTITPYLLTVTANAQTKVYGAADPALTYTNGALQNGDTNAVFTGGLTRVAGQNVGAYAINQGTLSAGTNYTISYTGNNLTITPYLLTVTANAQTKVYGAADPALTYTNGALQAGDTNAVFTGGLDPCRRPERRLLCDQPGHPECGRELHDQLYGQQPHHHALSADGDGQRADQGLRRCRSGADLYQWRAAERGYQCGVYRWPDPCRRPECRRLCDQPGHAERRHELHDQLYRQQPHHHALPAYRDGQRAVQALRRGRSDPDLYQRRAAERRYQLSLYRQPGACRRRERRGLCHQPGHPERRGQLHDQLYRQ